MERVLTQHIYRLDMCTLCGLCVKTCPSDALDYGKRFEHAVFDRRDQAVAALTRLLAESDQPFAGWIIPIEPFFQPLRGSPGFERALATLAERAR